MECNVLLSYKVPLASDQDMIDDAGEKDSTTNIHFNIEYFTISLTLETP
jgi:hypothetical protein